VNSCIFYIRLESSLLRARSHKLSGNKFQTVGLATKKAHQLNVLICTILGDLLVFLLHVTDAVPYKLHGS